MHILLDRYDSNLSMELAYVFIKQKKKKINENKLVSRRLAVDTDTEYLLNVTQSTCA